VIINVVGIDQILELSVGCTVTYMQSSTISGRIFKIIMMRIHYRHIGPVCALRNLVCALLLLKC